MDEAEELDSVQAPDSAAAVSDEDLEACLRVLRVLATPEGGVSEAYREPRFKPLRKAQQVYLDELRGQLFHGHQPDKYRQGKEKKRTPAWCDRVLSKGDGLQQARGARRQSELAGATLASPGGLRPRGPG